MAPAQAPATPVAAPSTEPRVGVCPPCSITDEEALAAFKQVSLLEVRSSVRLSADPPSPPRPGLRSGRGAPRNPPRRPQGIIPALETSHAFAYLEKLCPTLKAGTRVVLNCSGRGDKDVNTAAKAMGMDI